MFVYVVVYTLWLKRTSTWSTSVGAVSGAMPPVIGYAAVTGKVDLGAWLLFAMLFLWQPPFLGPRHPPQGRIPCRGISAASGRERHATHQDSDDSLCCAARSGFGVHVYVQLRRYFYLIISAGLSVTWLYLTLNGLRAKDDDAWAKQNFFFSINYLTLSLIALVLNTIHG